MTHASYRHSVGPGRGGVGIRVFRKDLSVTGSTRFAIKLYSQRYTSNTAR
jgi:hypothetical protein